MKKIFTFSIAIFISLSAFCAQTVLSISSTHFYRIRLVIDDRTYDQQNRSEVMIRNMDAGYHYIKIYQEKNRRPVLNGSGNNGMQLIYKGNIRIKSGFHTDIIINRFGKIFIDENRISFGYETDNDQDYDWQYNDRDNEAMNSRDFTQLKQTIRNGNFESTKLTIAKEAVGKNCFTSAQVKEIMELFSFENSKLELAKFAYRSTFDKENYFIVNDAFTFSSSKEELTKFMETSR